MSYPEFIGVFTAFFVAFYKYYYTLVNEKSSKNELIVKLNKYRYLEFYQQRLKRTLLNLDSSLGELSWSTKFITDNIMFHYGLSIIYVFFIYYFLWIMRGIEVFSTVNLVDPNSSVQSRSLTFLGLSLVFFLIHYLEKKKKDPDIIDLYQKIFSLVGGMIGIGLVVIMKGNEEVAGFLIALVLIMMLAVSYAYQKTFLKRIISIGSFGFMSIISFLILGSIEYFNGKSFFNEITISIYLFLIILPMINSQFDFVSLSISRYFSKKIANDNSVLLIFIHLLLDIFFAVMLLLILVNFLYNAIEYINRFVDINKSISIKDIFLNTMQNPFSLDNIWITAMLLTTLLPTLIHFLLAIITFILYTSKVSSWYVSQIEDIKENREDLKMKLTVLLALPSTVISLILSYVCLYLPYSHLIKWIGSI